MGVWVLQNVTKGSALTASVEADSVRGSHRAYGDNSVLEFTVDDELGTITIDTEDEIYLTDDGVKVFHGICRQVEQTDQGLTTQRKYAVKAQDWNARLDDDVVDAGFRSTSESDKQRIAWLFATFGTHGINAGASVAQLLNPMPADQDFTGLTLRESVGAIAGVTGGIAYVDFDKVLHYFLTESISAPFALSDTPNYSTTFEYQDFRLPRDSVDKINAVFVVGDGINGWRYQGGSPPSAGTRRAVTIRDPEITTTAQINATGDAYLAAHSSDRQLGSLVTYKPGLLAGMTIQITNAGWGYTATSFRITAVEYRLEGKDRIRYDVSFGGTPVTLAEYFTRFNQRITTIARAVQDTESVVIDLSVGGGNLVPNSSFEDGTSWSVGAQWVIGFDPVGPEEAFSGSKTARIALAAQTAGNLVSPYLPVARTDDYWFSAWRFVRSRSSGTVRIYLEEISAANAVLATWTFDVTAVDTDWTRVSMHFANVAGPGVTAWNPGTVKVRVGASTAGAVATLTADVDGFQLERGKLMTAYAPMPYELIDGQIVSADIADGAIITAKLAALAVDANKIAANAIVAGKIAAGVIGTAELAAGAITTAKIAVGAVIGNVDNGPHTVVIDATGIVINQGVLTLLDEYGITALAGSLFSGNVADYLHSGLYNGSFAAGTSGSLPEGRNANLPFWTVVRNPNGFGATTPTFAPGQVAVTFPNGTATCELYSDKVPCDSDTDYIARLRWGATLVAATLTAGMFVEFYAANKTTLLATVSLGPRTIAATRTMAWDPTVVFQSPAGARWMRVGIGTQGGNSGNSTTFEGVQIDRYTGSKPLIYPATSSLTLSTSSADVPGAASGDSSNPIFLQAGARMLVIGTFHIQITATDPGEINGELWTNLNGGAFSEEAGQAAWDPNGTGRTTVAQAWIFVAPSTGGYILKLRGKKTNAGGTAAIQSGESKLLVMPIS